MNRVYLRLAFFLVLALLAPYPLQASLTLVPGEGFVDEAGDSLHTDNAKGQLDVARNLESKEAYKDAAKSYAYLVRRWPLSIYSGEAQFKIGLMNEKMGEFWRAFKAYQLVVSKYPGSQFFDLAIERQYSIGTLFLAGERQKLWKIPLLSSQEKTTEIFNSVIKAAPYGKYAAPSYFQIGQARERQQKWTQAIEAYNTILDKYPNSDLADDAQYQIGFAWLQASRQTEYDQSSAQKAIQAFQDFMIRFPKSEKAAQAELHIRRLKGRTSQGTFNIARFYERQRNYKAAYIYYNEVIKESDRSPYAHIAQARIELYKKLFEKQNKKLPNQPATADETNLEAKLDTLAKEPIEGENTQQARALAQDTLDEQSTLKASEPTADATEQASNSSDDDEASSAPGEEKVARAILPTPGSIQSNESIAQENATIKNIEPGEHDPVAQVEKATRLQLTGEETAQNLTPDSALVTSPSASAAQPDDVLKQLDQVIQSADQPSTPAPPPSSSDKPTADQPSSDSHKTGTPSKDKPPKPEPPAEKKSSKKKSSSKKTPPEKPPQKEKEPSKAAKEKEKKGKDENADFVELQPIEDESKPQEPVRKAIPNIPEKKKPQDKSTDKKDQAHKENKKSPAAPADQKAKPEATSAQAAAVPTPVQPASSSQSTPPPTTPTSDSKSPEPQPLPLEASSPDPSLAAPATSTPLTSAETQAVPSPAPSVEPAAPSITANPLDYESAPAAPSSTSTP